MPRPIPSCLTAVLLTAVSLVVLAAASTPFAPAAAGQDTTRVVSDPEIELLHSLVEADPDDLTYRIRLATAYFQAGRYEEAARHYEFYVDGTQATPAIIRNYLYALTQVGGREAEGERLAAEYARVYPTDDVVHKRLGYFRLWQQKYSLARRACEQAVRLAPGDEQAAECVMLASRPDPPRGGPFIVDRLQHEVDSAPADETKRFALVDALIDYDRYPEAWDHLLVLEPRHGVSARWLDAFLRVDRGLRRADGTSPLYPIDRLTFMLRTRPDDVAMRLELVDLLAAEHRFAEALDVLLAPASPAASDPRVGDRLREIVERRERYARGRIKVLAADGFPESDSARIELRDRYLTIGRTEEAHRVCERLAGDPSTGFDARVSCAETYLRTGHAERAAAEAGRLIALRPDGLRARRLLVRARIAAGDVDSATERMLEDLLADIPNGTSVDGPAGTPAPPHTQDADIELLLTAAEYRVTRLQFAAADSLLRRAEGLSAKSGEPAFARRMEGVRHLIDRETLRVRLDSTAAIRRDARLRAAEGRYATALELWESYFEAAGRRTRPDLEEFAGVHAEADRYGQALAILLTLQERRYDTETARHIVRIRIEMGDTGGALADLDRLVAENPGDWSIRFMRADLLAELGRYDDALAVYEAAPERVRDSEAIERRRRRTRARTRSGIVDPGDWSGLDYVGIVSPGADAVRARGGGTRYDRWTQGMQTHVTTPIGLVVLAGIDSHFLSGSRRLVPDAATVRGRINRVWLGGIHDFGPRVASERASYTSRLTFQGGLYDYEGGRTVPFGFVRYWRQAPGVYDASLGVRVGEGSIDLWSPAGGQFDLRLVRFNLRGSTTSVAADSTIRLAGNISVNLVTDNLGSSLESDMNTGSDVRLEAGYRIARDTWAGVQYHGIDYRSTVDIYWSPRNFSQYDAFLEYEGEVHGNWYLRVRASAGVIARSNGFVARRLEADYIKRLDDNFSIALRTGLSSSTRSLGSAPTGELDRYHLATFGGALYWTL